MKLRILLVAALLAAGCSSDPSRPPPTHPFKPDQRHARELRLEAGQLYRAARQALDGRDYATAIERYDQLTTRYPFSEYATQAQLEKIYAQYRSFDRDAALAGADRFLREHPRHAHVDYVQYLKGLCNFEREEGLSDLLNLDRTSRDMGYARRAFDDFGVLVQKYPNSLYAPDAQQRMIFLRNQIAQSELHAVRFYLRRGAYVAAAKRSEQIIAQYPGAPATIEALQAIEQSYRALGLETQAQEAAALLAANADVVAAAKPQNDAAADAAQVEAAPPPAPASEGGWQVELGGKPLYRSEGSRAAEAAPATEGGSPGDAGPEDKEPGWIIELGGERVGGSGASRDPNEPAPLPADDGRKADAKAETSPAASPPAPTPSR